MNWERVGAVAGVVALVAAVYLGIAAIGSQQGEYFWPLYPYVLPVPTPPPIQFSTTDFGHNSNGRYNFEYAFPREWARSDPTNEDGASYEAPNGHARMAVYGALRLPDLPSDLQFTLQAHENSHIQTTDVGTDLWIRCRKDNQTIETKRHLDAKRLTYQHVDQTSRRTMTALMQFSEVQDRQVTILAEAPSEEYARYGRFFLTLFSFLRIYADRDPAQSCPF